MREKKSFNDVTDHYSKYVGLPTGKVEMKKMPNPLWFIGYFFSGWDSDDVFLNSGVSLKEIILSS